MQPFFQLDASQVAAADKDAAMPLVLLDTCTSGHELLQLVISAAKSLDFYCTIYALFITDPMYFDTLNVVLVEFPVLI